MVLYSPKATSWRLRWALASWYRWVKTRGVPLMKVVRTAVAEPGSVGRMMLVFHISKADVVPSLRAHCKVAECSEQNVRFPPSAALPAELCPVHETHIASASATALEGMAVAAVEAAEECMAAAAEEGMHA